MAIFNITKEHVYKVYVAFTNSMVKLKFLLFNGQLTITEMHRSIHLKGVSTLQSMFTHYTAVFLTPNNCKEYGSD